MNRSFARCLAVCLSFLILTPTTWALDGTPTPIHALPAAVQSAATQACPQVDWKIAFKFEPKGSETWYNVGGHDPKGRLVVFKVEQDGEWRYVRTDLAQSDVPPAVAAALQQKFPQFTPTETEGVSKDAERFLFYRFAGRLDGKLEEVLISPDGARVTTEAEAIRTHPEGSRLPAATPVAASSAPLAVLRVLQARLPDFRYTRVEALRPGGQAIEFYRFIGSSEVASVQANAQRLFLGGRGQSQEVLTPSDLPDAVAKQAATLAPGAVWNHMARIIPEEKSNAGLYFLRGNDAQRRQVMLQLFPDGTIFQHASQITAEALPRSVADTVRMNFPGLSHAWNSPQVVKGEDGAPQAYIVHGSSPRGEHHFIVKPDGSLR